MIYLDYSATTKAEKEVLEVFNKVSELYYANPNSFHKLGSLSNELIEKATIEICSILNIKKGELIYTSGASESNNMAIKGICLKNMNRGKHIITTPLEHSSVVATLNYLYGLGFEVDMVNLKNDGTIDIEHLKSLLRDDTILVTICAVDSETGIRQPIEEIGKLLKGYNKCYFHTDMTQCLGKDRIDLKDVDLASFSGHKVYCFKGIGGLYKKENISIEPLIHGGRSTTIYRSGTPQTELIVAMARAIKLITKDVDKNYDYVLKLNKIIKEGLSKYENVHINSTDKSIPHILNFSVVGIKPETMLHALEEFDIFISTKSACSKGGEPSLAVMSITNNKDYATSSVRVSLSYKTTIDEINEFLRCFDICYKKLYWK